MGFETKKFKKNIMFFIVSFTLLVILLLVTTLMDSGGNTLDKVDLNDNDVNINDLVINEIMTSNNGVLADTNGNIYDYIELYNGSDKDINLESYGLSDEGTVKWVFPNVTIKANEYMIVYLSGTKEDGLYAPFKLKSSGGEVITLFRPNGKVIDAVDIVSLDSNMVMARDENGKWVLQNKATPGYSNNIDGYNAFIKSIASEDEKTIVINELLPNNKGNFVNENGEYSGYIEVINVSDKKVDLTNYSLSNDESISFKWQFPSVTLSPGEVLGIYTSGVSNKVDTLSTSFKLRSKNGSAILTNNKGKVIDKVTYENLASGVALIRDNGKMHESIDLSFGQPNTVDGIKKFQKKYLKVNKGLIISEAMSLNYKYLPHNGGEYYDWIELYNNTSETIKLSDYCLTTNTDTMCMYKLPDKELKKGGYYVVMASGDTNLSTSKYKHANFNISDTQSVYITKSNDVIDSLVIHNVPKGYSIGKGESEGIYYFKTPTPLKDNSSGTRAIAYVPSASVPSGIFNDSKSFKVSLTGDDKIYYTTDGSTPTTSSKVYSSPLTIKKTTVLRIMSKSSNKLKSDVVTYSYIVNENHKVPVMSIAIDESKLNRVNSHTSLNSSVIEECDVELIEKDGTGFKISAGLKLFGGSTRSYKKKSYEIKFKKEFGDSKLEYKVFDDVDSSRYDSLVLRTGSQDEFQYNDQRTVIKDVVATSLMGDYTDVDVQDYKSIILYINGEYWGIYFIREKVDETFVANHYNVKTTEENTSILRIDGEVKSGTNKEYNSLISYVTSNNLNTKKHYNYVKERIDIQSFCDFWIGEIYTANYDILNTRYFSNPNVDGGKWKYIFYDLDSGFFRTTNNSFREYTNPSGMGFGYFPTTLLRNMMKSDEFEKTFLERLSYNLNNTWKYENVSKRIDSVINEFGKDEFKRNASRWGNSYSHWESSIKAMKKFAKNRNSNIVSQAKSYFGLSNSEVKKYFGDVE